MGASESKLAFKEDIFRLAGEGNIPIDSQWWSRFFTLPESAEDVQNLWSPNDLRSLTFNTPKERPPLGSQIAPRKNAETLIHRTVSRLYALQTRRVYDDPSTPIAPEVLNGVRILTRLLPYIYEADHLQDWEASFFWTPRKAVEYVDLKTGKSKFYDSLNEAKPISEERKDVVLGPPLGEQLVDILVDYLFLPNFSLPAKKHADGSLVLKPAYVVWQSGIGANKGIGQSKENERNAMEVLRLLLALSSRTMYFPPGVVADRDIKPLTYLTTQTDRQIVLNTLCSLLNTVLKYNQNPWSFPIDLGAATKDSKQPLVTHSLQLLLVLITYPVPDNGTNEFRKALGRLHRAEDFQFIVEGLRQILMQPTSSMLRPVQRLTGQPTPIAPETLSLFWELLQCNKRFRSYLIDTDRAKDFVVLVLYYANEAKDDPAKQGIVRMCVLILQTMSVEANFGRKLNTPFTFQETLPSTLQIPNFHGSYADFLIGHIHALLTSPNRGLESLNPALLAIVNNIGPYVQDLQRATSSMLLNLFVTMSRPSFLLANESNYVLLFSLLDAMSALLEHQREENRRFVDVVVKARKRFEALRDFTVNGALEELDRQNKERKDAGEATGVRTPSRNASLEATRPAIRSPTLRNVPEDDTFAIGDDEDEEEDGIDTISSPASASTSIMDESLPLQSRSMSEKARGKQPVGQSSFSRTTSRNTSNTSLNTLQAQNTTHTFSSQPFSPTLEWLNTWLPYVPLHQILQTIEDVARSDPKNTITAAATAPSANTSNPIAGDETPREVKVQTFRWTQLALGWYLSMIWGWTYQSDPARVWAGTSIKLFNVLQSQRNEVSIRNPRGAVDAVGDTIIRRIGSLSLPGSNSANTQTMREV